MTVARALVAIALLALPATAHAGPWSAPTPIQGTPDATPTLTFAGNGTGLAAWSVGGVSGDPAEVFGATISPGGEAGPVRRVASGMLAAHFATHGSDGLVAAGGTYGLRPRPLFARGKIDGTLGPPRALAGRRRGHVAGLAANPTGDFAAILRLCAVRGKECSRPAPHLVVHRARGGLSKPIRLGRRAPVIAAAVAVNWSGSVLAVWERPLKGGDGLRGIYARVLTPDGRLRPTQRIGTSHPVPRLSVVYGHHGGAVVGWLSQRMGEGMPHSPADVFVAVARPNQRQRFDRAQLVERVPRLGTGRYVGHAGVRVAYENGRVVVAWTGYENGRFVMRAAPVDDGVLGAAQMLSDPAKNTVLSDMATGPLNGVVVVGLSGIRGADPDGAVGVVASARLPGAATFSPLETVAEPKDYREEVDVEFTPSSETGRRIVVVWRDLGTRSLVSSWREGIS